MIDVDDEIADLQVAQIRQERLGRRATPIGRAPLLVEDVRFGVDLQPGVRQPESPRQIARGDQHRRVSRIVGPLDRNGEDVVFLEQLDRPLGTAGVAATNSIVSPSSLSCGSPRPSRGHGRAFRPPADSAREPSGRQALRPERHRRARAA